MSRFDPVQFCANIERYKITAALIVPPVLVVLSRHPAVDEYDISTIEVLFSGAAPLGAALTRQVKERLEARKPNKQPVYVLQGYGLTETSPTTHLLQKPDAIRKIGSIGPLLPNLEARLVVDGDGEGLIDAEEGQQGELWVRGPSIMKGYLNNPTATKDSITHDMWFKTGDIAVRDKEGYYTIVDRRKELIKYKVRLVFCSKEDESEILRFRASKSLLRSSRASF
jgi:4-coumarate--CoA ligase